MKAILNTTKIGILLFVIILICSIQYAGLSKQDEETPFYNNSRHVLSVSDAKEFALKSEENKAVMTVKGIYSGTQTENIDKILLEDEEPTGLEDILLYCNFSAAELNSLHLKPGTEITVQGKISRRLHSIELTDCKLICINEAVLLQDFTKKTE